MMDLYSSNYLVTAVLEKRNAVAFRQRSLRNFYMQQLNTKQTLPLWIRFQKVTNHLSKISTRLQDLKLSAKITENKIAEVY